MLIACILIYHFNMDAYWYAIAAAVWAVHLASANPLAASLIADSSPSRPHLAGGLCTPIAKVMLDI